jgi:elongation factor Ts
MTTTTTITPDAVRRLRELTGAGIMDCKRALEEAGGDVEQAVRLLRERGLSTAAKKAERPAREGIIAAYVHHGDRLAAMVEVNCETDFVARTPDFQQLGRELAIHVAGHPDARYVSRGDVPTGELEERRAALAEEAHDEGIPADRLEQVVEARLGKWLESVCLLEVQFRDTEQRVGDVVTEKIALLGENIKVARFVRMAVGETADEGTDVEAA